MHLDKKIAPRTPTKTAKKISTPSAPAKPMYNQLEFSSREDDDKIYMPTEERAQGKQMPSPPLTAADYKELRIMAAAAGYDEDDEEEEQIIQGKQITSHSLTAADYKELRIMAEAAGYDEEEDDSDYEPSDEEEDDDESLAHTEDMKVDELFSLETAIDDTWEIYISSIGKQKLRASKELSELADQLYRFHLSS
jgi:TATA-binding protein-associated factor Taf7